MQLRIVSPVNGVVERWLFEEGQLIGGKPVVIITNRQAVVRLVPHVEAGTILQSILAPNGTTVTQGTNLALIKEVRVGSLHSAPEQSTPIPVAQVSVDGWLTFARLLRPLCTAFLIVLGLMAIIALDDWRHNGTFPPLATLWNQAELFLLPVLGLYILIRVFIRFLVSHKEKR